MTGGTLHCGERRAPDWRLYLVTDTKLCGSKGVVATVAEAVEAGVTTVQIRDHDCTDGEFVRLGRALAGALSSTSVPLIVNNRAALVEPIGADGLHVGQRDMGPVRARRLIGLGRWLGLSVGTQAALAQARALPPDTLDYLGVGPVWAQQTKLDAEPAIGPDGLAQLVQASPWPCVAIGGIKAERMAAVRRAGAAGAAVVSAICGQPDVRAATAQLWSAWEGRT